MSDPGSIPTPMLALSGRQVVDVCVLPLAVAAADGTLIWLPTRRLAPGPLRSAVRTLALVPPLLASVGLLGVVALNVWSDGPSSLVGNAPEFLVLTAAAGLSAAFARRLWTSSSNPPAVPVPVPVPNSAPDTGLP